MNKALEVSMEREVLGKDFRIYGDVNNPLFLARDIAEWIEYSEGNVSHMCSMVDPDEVKKIYGSLNNNNGTKPDVSTGLANRIFLTEDGLYEVLMQSRKPIAKEFKKQVKQILKDIRRHGIYATDEVLENILTSPDFGIKLLTELKTEREKRKALEVEVAKDKPKVLFAKAVETSSTSILIGDLAKLIKQNGYDVGQKRLFEWLRENNYLMKMGDSKNMPTQKSMDLQLFEVKESTIINPDGSVRITKTTKVTGKGQIYFVNKFINQRTAV